MILVAAGQGARLGAGAPKALVRVGDATDARTLVAHALASALRCASITEVVVVAPPETGGVQQVVEAIDVLGPLPRGVDLKVVPGGAERVDSVAAGLAALPASARVVLVHDAARAFTPSAVFDRVVEAVRSGKVAVVPGLPVTDTIKQVARKSDGNLETDGDVVIATPDRASLRAIQTPQGFQREELTAAHSLARSRGGGAPVTDDAGLVEAAGGQVAVVLGDARAMKITTPHDLELAVTWVRQEEGSTVGASTSAPGSTAVAIPRTQPRLIVLGGLPGVGKTSLARALSQRLRAAHLRVDTIEQALVRGGTRPADLGPQGYGAALGVAADQLQVGLSVVADMVNGVSEARQAWADVASASGVPLLRVLVHCSDEQVHRSRVEARTPDIAGHQVPAWERVRDSEFEPWPEAEMRIDTAHTSIEDAAWRIQKECR